MSEKPKPYYRQHPVRASLFAGLVVIVVVAFGLAQATQPDDSIKANGKTLTYTVDNPSEDAVSSSYSVVPNQPLSIQITAANISGYIQKVGIDQNHAVTAPNNVNLAGWFTSSSLPGGPGLSIIDGHVDGFTQRGIFHSLDTVKAGDEVVITFGDHSTKKFSVFAAHAVAVNDTSQYLYDQDPSVSSQLNIITCTGKYDVTDHEYTQRFIVSAKLES